MATGFFMLLIGLVFWVFTKAFKIWLEVIQESHPFIGLIVYFATFISILVLIGMIFN